MELDVLNPYSLRIIIAARKEDSIRAISKRIGLSYGWTYKWAKELEKLGVFRKSGNRVFLNEKNIFYRKLLGFLKATFRQDVMFHYRVLGLFGIKYCFTGIDAVFVWTNGGYNISRYRKHYPVFIKVQRSDKKILEFYIKKLGLKGEVFYSPVFLEDFPVFIHDGMPVDSLEETIHFMKNYIYNFQPALEMVQEMYGKELGARYKEAVTNV